MSLQTPLISQQADNLTRFTPSQPVQRNQLRLAVLQDCNPAKRIAAWTGALQGNQRIGCGINALTFLGEISSATATQEVSNLASCPDSQGTPFTQIVDWFNKRQDQSNPLFYQEFSFVITTGTAKAPSTAQPATSGAAIAEQGSLANRGTPEDGMRALYGFFSQLQAEMPNNSCTIVKLKRSPDVARELGLTPGHTVVIAKADDGTLSTIDPQQLSVMPFKGRVSAGFYNAYVSQGYSTASVVTASQPNCSDLIRILALISKTQANSLARNQLVATAIEYAKFIARWRTDVMAQHGGQDQDPSYITGSTDVTSMVEDLVSDVQSGDASLTMVKAISKNHAPANIKRQLPLFMKTGGKRKGAARRGATKRKRSSTTKRSGTTKRSKSSASLRHRPKGKRNHTRRNRH
jgi:hypothetical protein